MADGATNARTTPTYAIRKKYIGKMQDWWDDLDSITLESITGLHESGYSSDGGPQSFMEACNDWWRGQDYDFQRELYCKSQS